MKIHVGELPLFFNFCPCVGGVSSTLTPSSRVEMWHRPSWKKTFRAHWLGFPGSASSKKPICQHKRQKRCPLDPWLGKISCRRAWQPTPVFLPGESPWTEEPGGLLAKSSKESDVNLYLLARISPLYKAWKWRRTKEQNPEIEGKWILQTSVKLLQQPPCLNAAFISDLSISWANPCVA